ncbi:MAG TPA: hypothetical protein VMZ71_08140 [Gemmataceae bacterium]|nr:hypothetical protein [Gemmataceae bacterium]
MTILALGASLLVASGCRHPGFNRGGSGTGSGSSTGCKTTDSCFDPSPGRVVSGPTGVAPGTLIPGASVPLIPGPGGMGSPSNELPLPSGLDRIPPTSVPATPNAPRSPAPGEFGSGDGSRIAKPVVGK